MKPEQDTTTTPENDPDIVENSPIDLNEKPIQAEEPSWEQKHNELNDKFLRVAAELQNTQRRAAKEKKDLLMYGNEKLIQDFLPVLDAFEKALTNKEVEEQDSENEGVWQGIELIHDQLTKTLNKHGLKKIDSTNQAFDPLLHQAIQKIESSDVNQETVLQEFASGYTLNGRLIRAAMVQVGTPKE